MLLSIRKVSGGKCPFPCLDNLLGGHLEDQGRIVLLERKRDLARQGFSQFVQSLVRRAAVSHKIGLQGVSNEIGSIFGNEHAKAHGMTFWADCDTRHGEERGNAMQGIRESAST